MNKKIIMMVLFVIMLISVTGCSARYPAVRIDPAPLEAVSTINIGSRYEYIDFDVVTTDSGKDVIIHFVLEEEGDE